MRSKKLGLKPSISRVTSILDRDTFEKYRDTAPMLYWQFALQEYALLLLGSIVYTTYLYQMHLPFVPHFVCRSIWIRGCCDTPQSASAPLSFLSLRVSGCLVSPLSLSQGKAKQLLSYSQDGHASATKRRTKLVRR